MFPVVCLSNYQSTYLSINWIQNKAEGISAPELFDAVQFWKALAADYWRPITLPDLLLLRGLQQEQYAGYQHFLLSLAPSLSESAEGQEDEAKVS